MLNKKANNKVNIKDNSIVNKKVNDKVNIEINKVNNNKPIRFKQTSEISQYH